MIVSTFVLAPLATTAGLSVLGFSAAGPVAGQLLFTLPAPLVLTQHISSIVGIGSVVASRFFASS
jgi:hypothetical protein